jgi:hypothetical protein
MPVASDQNPRLKINDPTTRALGITIPAAVLKRAVTVK